MIVFLYKNVLPARNVFSSVQRVEERRRQVNFLQAIIVFNRFMTFCDRKLRVFLFKIVFSVHLFEMFLIAASFVLLLCSYVDCRPLRSVRTVSKQPT